MSRMRALALLGLVAALAGGRSASAADATLTLKPGDHISLIGNALAERQQHDGWLEADLQSRFPKHELVVRNLGFAGDEVANRLRSENFGSPDDWLTRTKSDVVFAYFGFGESFGGEKGLPKFRDDLDKFVKHTLSQNYGGKGNARLVLFTPIAFEDLGDRNLPDGKAHNDRLALYAKAIAEVAASNEVPVVDLYGATLKAYDAEKEPLTIDGVHLNSLGNKVIAGITEKALFPNEAKAAVDTAKLEKTRQAVVDKDFYHFNRYHTTDGYNVYGGRSKLSYPNGSDGKVTNLEVMNREMEILDTQTANRDKRVWAVANGGDLKVDDSSTPAEIPVKTNFPGTLPGGGHVYLGGEEAIAKMTVADGMEVKLFASEEQFPELINPVQMAFDAKGRLWVATWPTYPHWTPKTPQNDRLLILEDTDGDGKADRTKTFAGDLSSPTGFEFWNGGVIVTQAPDLVFLKDTDGDDKYDVKVRILHGVDSADTHHTADSYVIGPDGALYFQEGVFHQSQIESIHGVVRNHNASMWRFEPRTGKVERYVPFDFANPHGHVFDRWGQDFVVDGTGSQPYHCTLFSGFIPYPKKHSTPPQLYKQRTRPCPGIEMLSSRHFPEKSQGNLLVGNVIGFQGILQYKIDDNNSSFAGTEVEPIVSSTDRNFRPADMKIGPDGAIWFTDWQNAIIGHMQHHLRDPNRDKVHGRVYRIVAKGRDLLKSPTIAGEPIPKLLDLLKEPEDRVRYRVRIELSGRKSDEVVAAAKAWADKLDKADPQYEHNLLEALWVCQQHNVIDIPLLDKVLAAKEPKARAAGVHALVYGRDQVPNFLDRLKKAAGDPHPRVRLEAVRGASFSTDPEAAEIPLLTLEHPSDAYLDYTRQETLKALDALPK